MDEVVKGVVESPGINARKERPVSCRGQNRRVEDDENVIILSGSDEG